MRSAWWWLSVAILCEVVATSALRLANGFTQRLPGVVALTGYVASFYCLSLALRDIPLGVAYAVWCGVGLVLISVVGYVIYGQVLDKAALAGIVLIGLGVLTINVFSVPGGGA